MKKSIRILIITLFSIIFLGGISGLVFYRRIGFAQVLQLGEINTWVLPDEWIFVDSPWDVSEIRSYNPDSKRYRIVDTPEIGFSPNATFSTDGSLLGYTDNKGDLRIVEVSTGEVLFKFINHNGWPISISAEYNKIVAWKQDQLYLIDIGTQTETLIYQMDKQLFDAGLRAELVEWRPNTEEIIFVLNNLSRGEGLEHHDEINLFNTITLENQLIFSQDDRISDLKWSPNGNFFVYSFGSYSTSFGIRIFDLENQCLVYELETSSRSNSLWSPDGKKILYNSDDSIKLLDIQEEFGVPYDELTCPVH